MMPTISHYIVSLVGIGYTVVGVQQYLKGNLGSSIMWIGYGFSQIGLFLQLER
jgi:hypothetical protein